jgi:hypothetical protein
LTDHGRVGDGAPRMRRPLVLLTAAPAALAALTAVVLAASPAAAARGCAPRADEVRFDDGRLLVERSERAVDPQTVRERWWSCWRPTGRRTLLTDRRHAAAADDVGLLAVRHGRVVVLAGGGRLDAYDGRDGAHTARVPVFGVVRELAVTAEGRVAALQDEGAAVRALYGGDATKGCLLDAGRPTGRRDAPFGGLAVRGERVTWFRDGVALAQDLTRLRCTG